MTSLAAIQNQENHECNQMKSRIILALSELITKILNT